jgi:hypothetical protein
MHQIGNNTVLPSNLTLPLVKAAGLAFAVTLGALIGRGDFGPLTKILGVVFAVAFATHLHRYLWHISLFLFFFNFIYRPTGFAITALELSCALGAAVIGITVWQKRLAAWPDSVPHGPLALMQKLLVVWLLYVVGHIVYTVKDPFSPADFSLNNALKSYFGLTAPYALLLYFSVAPAGIHVRQKYFWRICELCLVGLLINLGIRFYENITGAGYVFIPWINGINSIYTLRSVGPLAMLLGTVALCSAEARRFSVWSRGVSWSLVLIGTVGSVFSAGRASVVLGLGCILAALFFKRKYLLVFVALGAGFLAIITANLFADWVNNEAHPTVQRSLQWVLLKKSVEAAGSIENSSQWREELLTRTLAEWRSHPRIFWFGRATYSYSGDDETALFAFGGYEALIQTALRRGATHNLVGDLLIAYGIVGCVLYFGLYLAVLLFLWRMFRCNALTETARDLFLVCFISALFALILGVVAGGILPFETMIFMSVLIAAIYNGVALANPTQAPLKAPPSALGGGNQVNATQRNGIRKPARLRVSRPQPRAANAKGRF